MTKTLNSKTWIIAPDPTDNYRYSGPPADTTPPTAPVILFLSANEGSLTFRVSVPSVDAQTGVKDYIFFYQTSGGTLQQTQPFSVQDATSVAGITLTGLAASTNYSVSAKARDNSPNVNISAASNVVVASTPDASPTTSIFPNYPIMRSSVAVGNISSGILDASVRDYVGETDLVVFQWFYPTNARLSLRATGLDYIKNNYPGCNLVMYTIPSTALKTITTPQNNAMEIVTNLINGANGKPYWYTRRTGGQQTEDAFDTTNYWSCNMATGVSGLNNLGERYDQAYWRSIDTQFNAGTPANFLDTYSPNALYVDNAEARLPAVYINNGATRVKDIDMDGNGVTDTPDDYSAASTAGGRFWAQGLLNFRASGKARFGANWDMIPNAARWAFDYEDTTFLGAPPKPLNQHPFYGQWSGVLFEGFDRQFGIHSSDANKNYTVSSGGSCTTAYRRMAITDKMMGKDSDSVWGRTFIMGNGDAPDRSSTIAWTQDDYTFGRFMTVACLLVERVSVCLNVSHEKPLYVDELDVYLGPPLATRSMGSLNETTATFSLRSPDYTNGAAQFYWTKFQNGIVVARMDQPTAGVWPTADAAVTVQLPAPRAGKKWQYFDCVNYVNPKTGRKTRGQTPTLNSGRDYTAGSLALKPFHAAIVLEVPA
ncbi:MAG TPA: hypothetical protein VFA39_15670 [Steroidobacteraceae bacterium]|nr:hypothetical protein [Steroidobacteraceae bacterium]